MFRMKRLQEIRPYPLGARAIGLVIIAAFGFSACDNGTDQTVAAPFNPARPGARTNVIWIVLDACRSDHLSCYGYERPTSPNIDALAEQGTLFERTYAQGSNTVLSVPSYMTGRFEPVSYLKPGMFEIWFLRIPPEEEILISTIFKSNGYATAMFSASPWYPEESRLSASFDTFAWLTYEENIQENTYEERNRDLFSWLDQHADEPFFLYIHSMDTHEPRYANNTHDTWLDGSVSRERDRKLRHYSGLNGQPFSAAEQQYIVDLYDGGISYADETVGEIVVRLEQLGIRERTIVIIGADHGEVLGQDGRTFGHPAWESFDDQLHVPLIMTGPGVPIGHRVTSKTQNADIVPTLVDVLTLETSARFDGRSLAPIFEESQTEGDDAYVFARTMAVTSVDELNRIVIFDDIKFDLSPLTEGQLMVFGSHGRTLKHVWRMPDYAGARQSALPSAARQRLADQFVNDRLVPLWEAKDKLPKEAPPVFFIRNIGYLFPEDVTAEHDRSDSKWTLIKSVRGGLEPNSLGNIAYQDILVSYPQEEDTRPLRFSKEVPNGRYAISVFCAIPEETVVGRGVSFSFRLEDEEDWRIYELDQDHIDKRTGAWVDVGTYEVARGVLGYMFDKGRPEDDAVVGNLRLTRAGENVRFPSLGELEAEQERLRALGYIE